MFNNLFGKKPAAKKEFITITLNAKLQPMHRGDLEDALTKILEAHNIGEICGGGSLLEKNGEISECDIEIEAKDTSEQAIHHIINFLEDALAPKGSKLRIGEDRIIEFGQHEGLALYLNGTDLPDEVYQNNDINEAWAEIEKLLGEEGGIHSYHQGETETALYLYGNRFDTMHQLIEPFLNSYPLCQQCRVVQVV
ncbi:hypothetical protein [Pragia fontium]|uniref:Uncharacterized protein n=2 Tax=Pragia fontium TaxID=82985 RepID=A0AAJ4WDQ6_9GAMM|nr:hypothetical protein [Pragia fontium]GKX64707.1 hypothetical protein SOASR032_32760 [Pragia fontium]SFD46264.1 hypothetical protein SAMN02745723_12011 [Pragia fontium DSM 5563 = ATCC 49100]VEJ53217.1 Uncharacterised protein [Pragia fontium]